MEQSTAARKSRLNRVKESDPSILYTPKLFPFFPRWQQLQAQNLPAGSHKLSSPGRAKRKLWDDPLGVQKKRISRKPHVNSNKRYLSQQTLWFSQEASYLNPGGSKQQAVRTSGWSPGSQLAFYRSRSAPSRRFQRGSAFSPLSPSTFSHESHWPHLQPLSRQVIGPQPYKPGRWPPNRGQLLNDVACEEANQLFMEAQEDALNMWQPIGEVRERSQAMQFLCEDRRRLAEEMRSFKSDRAPAPLEETAYYRNLVEQVNTSSQRSIETSAKSANRGWQDTADGIQAKETTLRPDLPNDEDSGLPGALPVEMSDKAMNSSGRQAMITAPTTLFPSREEKEAGNDAVKKKTPAKPHWQELFEGVKAPDRERVAHERELEIKQKTAALSAIQLTGDEIRAKVKQRRGQAEAALAASRLGQKAVEDSALAPLSQEAELAVQAALDDFADRQEILVQHEPTNIVITRERMKCLLPGAWLNDEVINVYVALLKEREMVSTKKRPKCHFFNTFFYNKLYSNGQSYNYNGVRRWTSKKKLQYSLYDCEKIIVPVHQKIHWTLAVINLREKKLEFLDSMYGSDYGCLDNLARYIKDEVKDKNGVDLDVSSWPRICPTDIPEQLNGCDCGVFMVKYADYESRDAPFSFTQQHMTYFRRRMVWELLQLRAED